MVIANLLGGLATILWIGLFAYIAYVLYARVRGLSKKISIVVALTLILGALAASTASASVVVIDAREVGVVFNDIYGLRREPLLPGLHFVIPLIDHVYRYPTVEQIYTMTGSPEPVSEAQIRGAGIVVSREDTLWSPTIEGLQVGIDSSTRFAINPEMAPQLHTKLQDRYLEVLIRPTVRSVVRHYVSQNTVTDIYGPKRAEIQSAITEVLKERFEEEGLLLLSFDIRNVHFTEDYRRAIEQKQIAQQEAERMQYILEKERREAERKMIEAEGIKKAAITKAEGEAEALRLISEALRKNPDLLTYRYIEKLAPNVSVMMLPSGAPFIISLEQFRPKVEITSPE
jgi:regulator of protease activity HflC (stomatin/prohibitin superfamily)